MSRPRDFLALIKIGIVGTNVLTALAGFALASARAGGHPSWRLCVLLASGTAFLVGGSCAINNWLDRDIDAQMERTKERPTARGAMKGGEAIGIGVGLGLAGLALLWAASATSALVGLAGALVYLAAYTLWAKRRSASSSFVGGLAGAAPPLIGWAAVDPRLGGPAWALFALLLVWQQAHVRALALRRERDYRGAGVPMAGLSEAEGSSRAKLLAWAAAALPFPTLAIFLDRLPKASLPARAPTMPGPELVVALGSCALCAAWVAAGIVRFRSPSWPDRMFAASLAYLVLIFGALLVVGL